MRYISFWLARTPKISESNDQGCDGGIYVEDSIASHRHDRATTFEFSPRLDVFLDFDPNQILDTYFYSRLAGLVGNGRTKLSSRTAPIQASGAWKVAYTCWTTSVRYHWLRLRPARSRYSSTARAKLNSGMLAAWPCGRYLSRMLTTFLFGQLGRVDKHRATAS